MKLLHAKGVTILTLAALLLALLAGGALVYALLYLAVLTAVLPSFLTWLKLQKLQIGVDFADRSAQVGDTVDLKIRIHNAGHGDLPFVAVKTSLGRLPGDSSEFVLTVRAGETYILRKSIPCLRRGIYYVEHFEVTTQDPWGIAQFSRSPKGDIGVVIYPRVRQIQELPIDASQFYGSLSAVLPVFEDFSRLNDLRPWRPGDSPKRIHWRATAKADQLVVKSYELRADSRVVLLLDMCRNSYSNDNTSLLEDAAVETALAVLNSCLQWEIPVNLAVNSADPFHLAFTHSLDMEVALERFVHLTADGHIPPQELIAALAASQARSGAAIVVTPLLTEQTASALLLASDKLRPVLFLVSLEEPNTEQQQLITKLQREHITTFVIPVPEIPYKSWQFLPLKGWKGGSR